MQKKVWGNNIFAKSIASILLLVMLFFGLPANNSLAKDFADTKDHWGSQAIANWSDYGILEGDGTGSFNPDGKVTRAQQAAIFARLLALPKANVDNSVFTDIDADDWYYQAIHDCYEAGILQGSDGKALPNQALTREEAAVMYGRALGIEQLDNGASFSDGDKISDWAKGHVNALAQKGILQGYDNNFNPQATMSRAASATVMDNAIDTYINKDGVYDGTYQGLVLVTASNVTFQNATLENLIVSSNNSKAELKNSVKLGSNGLVAANDTNSKIELKDTKVTGEVQLQTPGANLSLTGNSSVNKIKINEKAASTKIAVAEGATVQKVVAAAEKAAIEGKGKVVAVDVKGNNIAVNTEGTKITLDANVKGTTNNGQAVNPAEPEKPTKPEEPITGGSDNNDNQIILSNKKAIEENLKLASEIVQKTDQKFHNWKPLADAINSANSAIKSDSLIEVSDARNQLVAAIEIAKNAQKAVVISDKLNLESFTSDQTLFDDFDAKRTTLHSLAIDGDKTEVKNATNALLALFPSATAKTANFVDTIEENSNSIGIAETAIREDGGFTIKIDLDGFELKDNYQDYKNDIIDGISFRNIIFNLNAPVYGKDNYVEVTPEEFKASIFSQYGGLTAYGYFAIRNGITDAQRYIGDETVFTDGIYTDIKNNLKKDGKLTIENGKLVISCHNDYFKNFTNSMELCNGGKLYPMGDLHLYANIPAEAVKENINIATDNYFNIMEIRFVLELWEYVDESHAGEPGVKKIYANYESEMENPHGAPGYYEHPHYVKAVSEGTELTEAMIREGGTYGELGEGKYLLKVNMLSRVGPTQWASTKTMTTFTSNMFRTERHATGYQGGSNDAYTPKDHPEWLKVEQKLLDEWKGSGFQDNKYYINYSGNYRNDTTEINPMWLFIEIPKVPDFNIDEDMTVYNTIVCGMVGGSGQSTAQNGQPKDGMDGRYAFKIKAIND